MTNRRDGSVRIGRHLEIGWQESYNIVGLVDDRVWLLEGDTRFSSLAISTLVPVL